MAAGNSLIIQFVEKYEFAEDATHYEAVAVANL